MWPREWGKKQSEQSQWHDESITNGLALDEPIEHTEKVFIPSGVVERGSSEHTKWGHAQNRQLSLGLE